MPEPVIEAPSPAPAPSSAPSPAPSPAPAPSPSPAPAPAPAPEPAPAPAPIASKWSDTWREDMAGTLADTASEEEKADHDKLLKRLKRFNSPADAAKALREQDKLISSGQLKKPLPKNATPEQVSAWRAENGIPETPDKYDISMPDGLVFGEDDKPIVDQVLKGLHGVNASNEVVKAALKVYADSKTAASEAMVRANHQAKRALENELRAEWGAEYDSNVDAIDAMLRNEGEDYSDFIFTLRTPEGTQAMNDPRFVRALAREAREKGFVRGTIVSAGGDIGKAIDEELGELRKKMGTPEWAKDDKSQKRFLDLTEAKERHSKRKA